MVSADGHCRPFDAAATGTVFGAGAGMVLLKRAEEAIADGDHIYALLLGAGINNDGSDKIGYAAPSQKGQSDAISMAYAVAGVDPASVDYVECHGTGTPLGDPIEVGALAEVFGAGEARTAPCLLSSVKGNIGHLDVAAGVTGLVKAAMSLDREKIPGTLHYSEPNPQTGSAEHPIHGGQSGDAVAAGTSDSTGGRERFWIWRHQRSRSAGRSSSIAANCRSGQAGTVPVCANGNRIDGAMCASRGSLEHAEAQVCWPDVAYTLAEGRRAFPHRAVGGGRNPRRCRRAIRNTEALQNACDHSERIAPRGHAVSWTGNTISRDGRGLYRSEPFYRDIVDDCCRQLRSLTGLGSVAGDVSCNCRCERIARHGRMRRGPGTNKVCAAGVVRYQLCAGKVVDALGREPACLVGHSVGELVAACVAGVFSLSDALLFVARRGEWMQEMPRRQHAGRAYATATVTNAVAGGYLDCGDQFAVADSSIGTNGSRSNSWRHSWSSKALPAAGCILRTHFTPRWWSQWWSGCRDCWQTMPLKEPQLPIISTVTGKCDDSGRSDFAGILVSA